MTAVPFNEAHARAIRLRLYAVAALVLAMVLVGGATRLTESGLSITEWRPVMGALPPLGDAQWQSEFEKYQAIPQYHALNQGMSLEAFKTIYWWEWTHRLLACVIYVALIWTAQRLGERPAATLPPRIRLSAFGLLIIVLVQIYLGALVAGLRAGYIYNTWPLIDGALVPDAARLLLDTPAWRNVFENTLTAQFDHRMVAYVIFIGALLHAFDVARTVKQGWVVTSAGVLAIAVTLQAVLGIATLLLRVPISLALAHQAMAMLVLTVATTHAALVADRRAVAHENIPLA